MVKFWVTKHGNYMSHNEGLTLAQISFLKSLSIGEQLVIFVNEDGSLTLKKSTVSKEIME